MAIQVLKFTLQASQPQLTLREEWSHNGVVGSGDLEVLLEKKQLAGRVEALVTTPVKGYDHVWERVLERFVEETGIYDIALAINDNNATPFLVALRLKQALAEAVMGDDGGRGNSGTGKGADRSGRNELL